jgi:AraC-like DNA-binding protein
MMTSSICLRDSRLVQLAPPSSDMAPIYFCLPPYSRLVEHTSSNALAALPAGSIVMATHPTAPLLLSISRSSPSAILLVGLRAGEVLSLTQLDAFRRAGVSGILALDVATPRVEDVLSAASVSSRSSSGELGTRLRLLGRPISAPFEAALEALIACDNSCTVHDWARVLGESTRNLERQCANEWVAPPPRNWVALVRAIRAVQSLQCRTEGSVESVLTGAGFRDPQSVRRLLVRVCGVSPVRVRSLLGWYFVVERWCAYSWNRAPLPRIGSTPNVSPIVA